MREGSICSCRPYAVPARIVVLSTSLLPNAATTLAQVVVPSLVFLQPIFSLFQPQSSLPHTSTTISLSHIYNQPSLSRSFFVNGWNTENTKETAQESKKVHRYQFACDGSMTDILQQAGQSHGKISHRFSLQPCTPTSSIHQATSRASAILAAGHHQTPKEAKHNV